MGVILFQSSSKSAEITDPTTATLAVVLNGQELLKTYQSGSAAVSADRVINFSTIGNYYTAKILKNIPLITILFCFILIGSSFLLWTILRNIQNKDTMHIVEKLKTLTEGNCFVSVDPTITTAYDSIKAKFTDNLEDYKRLNSYLSHEQKNAISILRTNLELNDNHEYIKSLDKISDSIDDILTLSDTLVNTQTTEVDITLICASICDEYRKISDTITFNFNEDHNTLILARERWISRAVSNLLDNAVKYGNNKPIEVTVKNENHSVIIIVRDQGIGMDKIHQDKIFNNRYRINGLNKAGYGIGLSLVSHVCDLCSGFVWVESVENQGSTFYLSFCEYTNKG